MTDETQTPKSITYIIGNIAGDLPVKKGMLEHKFIVMAKKENEDLEFTLHSQVMDDEYRHEQIVKRIPIPRGKCVGGGTIEYFEESGTKLNGQSTDYGAVHTDIRDEFGRLLAQKYGIKYAGYGIFFKEDAEEQNTKWEARHKLQIGGIK